MKYRDYLIVIGLLFCSTGGVASAAESSGLGKITEFYIRGSGDIVRVRFSQSIVNPEGCEGEEYYIRELDDSRGSDRFLSTVLAAYTANKTVKFWISGCTQMSYWGKTRPKIHDVYVNNW